jgi:hypothetical protein
VADDLEVRVIWEIPRSIGKKKSGTLDQNLGSEEELGKPHKVVLAQTSLSVADLSYFVVDQAASQQ